MSRFKIKDKLKASRRFKIAACFVVAAVTATALVLPASTVSTETYCGHEGHEHSEDCYTVEKTLICGQEESSGHQHTDECYETVRELVCTEDHEHTDECYKEEKVLVCDKEESEGHQHTDECYKEEKTLTCGLKEHEHTLSCYSNPDADLETEDEWEKTFEDVDVDDTDVPDNVKAVEIAKTQIGYEESTENYDVADDGETKKGITRYGQWYGDDYGDWCAMFCSFCIRYAGIDEEDFPIHSNCNEWIKELKDTEDELNEEIEKKNEDKDEDSKIDKVKLYHKYDSSYTPKSGDLVFYDWDDDGEADHIGFLYRVKDDGGISVIAAADEEDEDLNEDLSWKEDKEDLTLVTIEGNHNEQVEYVERAADSDYILGFGEVPDTCEGKIKHTKSYEGEDYKVTVTYTGSAKLPDDVELKVKEFAEDSDEYNEYYEKALEEYNDGLKKNYEIEITFARFFDISFVSDGEEIEPEDDVDVKIEYDDSMELGEYEEASAVHFNGKKVELLETKTEAAEDDNTEIDTFKFTADSFSVFGNTTTVKYKQQSGTYYKRVSSIDSTTDNYLIVSVEGDYALNRNTGSNPAATALKLNPVKGNEEYYTVTNQDESTIGDEVKWHFGSTEASGTTDLQYSTTITSGDYSVMLDDSNIVSQTTSGATITVNYSKQKNFWCFKGTAGYMAQSAGKFEKPETSDIETLLSEAENNKKKMRQFVKCRYLILKEVNETLDIPVDLESSSSDSGSSSSSSTATKPTYASYITPTGAISGSGIYSGNGSINVAWASDASTSQIESQFTGIKGQSYSYGSGSSGSGTATTTKTVTEELTLTGLAGTSPKGDSSFYNYEQLFDGDTSTKFYCNNGTTEYTTPVYVIFESSQKAAVTSYSLTTANDTSTSNTGRLPKSWILYGRNDKPSESYTKTGWNVVDEVTDPGMSKVDLTKYDYEVTNAAEYKYYMIAFTCTYSLQFSELSMTGTYTTTTSSSSTDGTTTTTTGDDGKVVTDKSVVYKADDYGAFDSYDDYTFGVTLSALAQEYETEDTTQVETPIDVVFIIDSSKSMTENYADATNKVTRTEAVVEAVNKAMTEILGENDENRVGIVLYSSDAAELLPLAHYTSDNKKTDATSGETIYQYLDVYEDTTRDMVTVKSTGEEIKVKKIRTNAGLKNSSGSVAQTDAEDDNNGFQQAWGTYTQYGIELGAKQLIKNADTTYTTTIAAGTDAQRQVTVERQPVMILLSDGDPTHCTSNYTDVASGPHYGDSNNKDSTNNGARGYYTILTANYNKRMVSINYNKQALMYSIGMGINETGYADLSGASYTGDDYKRAVLNPTKDNITALASSGHVNNSTTGLMLNQLLNNTYTGQYVSVGPTFNTQRGYGSKCLGSIVEYHDLVPIIKNPYTDYSYADNAYFGELDTEDLESIFNNIIKSSESVKSYGLILQKRTACVIEDEIGDGMEVKGDPKLYYDGKIYEANSVIRDGPFNSMTPPYNIYNQVSIYRYNYKYVATDGSGSTADLNNIVVKVYKCANEDLDEYGQQLVTISIPDSEMPVYTPGDNGNATWYYEALPVRLIYQVGLTDDSKDKVQGLESGETLTFYTNQYTAATDDTSEDIGATSVLYPTDDNPYYKIYSDYSIAKADGANVTSTALNSIASTKITHDVTIGNQTVNTQDVTSTLGNNGMLTFTSETKSLTVTKKWEGVDKSSRPDEIQLQLYRTSSTGEKTAIAVGDSDYATMTSDSEDSEGNWTYTFTGLAAKDSEGNAYEYYVEEVTGGQYTATYSTKSAKYDSTIDAIQPITVTNTVTGYELPLTGGTGSLPFTLAGIFLIGCAGAFGFRRYIKGGDAG